MKKLNTFGHLLIVNAAAEIIRELCSQKPMLWTKSHILFNMTESGKKKMTELAV